MNNNELIESLLEMNTTNQKHITKGQAISTPERPIYRYKVTSTQASSQRYGPCEVCKKHVSEVFIQSEEKSFFIPGDNQEYWTHYKCFSLFGHENCLISKQRNDNAK